jgi:hypothetical protein
MSLGSSFIVSVFKEYRTLRRIWTSITQNVPDVLLWLLRKYRTLRENLDS